MENPSRQLPPEQIQGDITHARNLNYDQALEELEDTGAQLATLRVAKESGELIDTTAVESAHSALLDRFGLV
jgi:ribosomal protein L29